MLTNMAATWLAVGIAWAGVLWWKADLTFVWAAMVITSPIMMLTMPAFRRRLESTRETFEADTPPPLPV